MLCRSRRSCRPPHWRAGRHERRRVADRPSAMPNWPRRDRSSQRRGGGQSSLLLWDCAWNASGCVPEHVFAVKVPGPCVLWWPETQPQQPCMGRESWRGHGFASGLFAATVRPKQFPRRCAPSSRSKFFVPTGPSLRCGLIAVLCGAARPTRACRITAQGRDGRDRVNF